MSESKRRGIRSAVRAVSVESLANGNLAVEVAWCKPAGVLVGKNTGTMTASEELLS